MNVHSMYRWLACALMAGTLAVFSGLSAGLPPAPRYISPDALHDHPNRVDTALILAVDVSSSIESGERLFQREAYARALSDPRVAHMALGGGAGRVAIAYLEWSGAQYQRLYLPIRVMSSAADLAQFAQDILDIPDHPGDPMYMQATAVGDALLAAETAMSALEVPARNYVIDISGDGVINDGFAVLAARDHLLSLGLTVNGLPIEVPHDPPEHDQASHERVSEFYADCVIGGPGAFHLVARGFGDVRETLIMKLMLEMARLQPAEKRRLAAVWNAGGIGNTARIIPATVLQLSPAPARPRRKNDCGEMRRPAGNPFATRR